MSKPVIDEPRSRQLFPETIDYRPIDQFVNDDFEDSRTIMKLRPRRFQVTG